MADTVTVLNKATVSGGDAMDESLVPSSSPQAPGGLAKRPRVVIGDDDGGLVDTATEGGITKLQVKAATLPLPAGAATEATLAQLTRPSDQQHVLVDNFPSSQPVTGPLTDAQLRASAVPVSGPLTDTQLRAGAVPVSLGSVPLPSGAATEATLALIQAVVTAIRDTDGIKKIVDAVAITAASLPLPSGAATETTLAARATEATLATIAATLASILTELGQKTEPANTQNVSVSNFPSSQAVTGPLTDTQLRATAVPVSASSLPLPSGASTEATLAAIKAKTDNIDVALSTRTKPADQQHVLVDNFPATQAVSGTVAVSNFPSTQPVSGPLTDAQLRATAVPVSGPLTDSQLRASAVPVSAASLPLPAGAATQTTLAAVLTELQSKTEPADQQHVLIDNFPATQPVSGTVAVSNFPATQPVSGPLTDAQLRATAVPVSGPLTDAQLRATAVPVSGPLTDVQLRASDVNVAVSSLPLPSGASTEATLAAIKAKTDNLDVALSTRTKPVDNQNVFVTNWPAELGGGVEKILYDTDDPSVFYIGTAAQGTASSAPLWRIKRILFDGSGNPLSTTWTGATAVWDNRASETYT